MLDETLRTYNNRSEDLAGYFAGIGPRVKDIERAFELSNKESSEVDVLELGCGDGRDAEIISKRVNSYTGVDYSEGMLALAKEKLPDLEFKCARMEDFEYPPDSFDIVFAFASFLHIDKRALSRVLDQIASSLRTGGVLWLSTKYAESYEKREQIDKFGLRNFYYYNPQLISEMTEENFDVAHIDRDAKGNSRHWFQMGLRKK